MGKIESDDEIDVTVALRSWLGFRKQASTMRNLLTRYTLTFVPIDFKDAESYPTSAICVILEHPLNQAYHGRWSRRQGSELSQCQNTANEGLR